MSNKVQYDNEVQARHEGGNESKFDPRYVVSIKATSDDFADQSFAEEAEKRGYYPFAIIMEAGDCSIQSIFHRERPDLFMVKSIFSQTTRAVEHMHSLGEIRVRKQGRVTAGVSVERAGRGYVMLVLCARRARVVAI